MAVGLKIVSGDFIINENGHVETLVPKEKCSRDFGKMLMTDIENTTNETEFIRYNPTYGTSLNNQLNYQGLSKPAVKDVLIMLVNQAIANYISIQEGRNNLTVDEIITSVDFTVYFQADDFKKALIDIKYKTLSSAQEQSLGQFTQSVG